MFVGSFGRTASAMGRVSVAIFTAVTFVFGFGAAAVVLVVRQQAVVTDDALRAVVPTDGAVVVDAAVTQHDEVVSRWVVVDLRWVATLSLPPPPHAASTNASTARKRNFIG